MDACEVSNIVRSIVSAYNNGLDVFRRVKVKKRSLRSKDTELKQEEQRLQTSLQCRPQDIRSEYEKNVAQYGYRFEIGDTIAHNSLAHTLLVLNSGLIKVINDALSSDNSRQKRLSQRSLLSVSEIAAADALYALGQLSQRLAASPPRLIPAPRAKKSYVSPRKVQQPKEGMRADKNEKRPGTIRVNSKDSNILVRGGWIRPTSRSKNASVVSVDSTQGSSTPPQPEYQRRRTGSSPSATGSSRSSKTTTAAKHRRNRSLPAEVKSSRTSSTIQPANPSAEQSTTSNSARASSDHLPDRIPSMLIMPADIFDWQAQTQTPPPRPPKLPLHSRPSGIRPRPPSVATFMTASTKIGEIPEHRWPDRLPLPNDAERPLPYVIPPLLAAEEPKKKSRGLKFWKRHDKEQEVASC